MTTQFKKGMDALVTYVGKEFGGVAGPMAANAIRTRNEEQTSPRIFNLAWAHTAEEIRAQLCRSAAGMAGHTR